MPGKKRTKEMLARLTANIDEVMELVTSGMTIAKIAKKFDTSRATFYVWKNSEDWIKKRFAEARYMSADALVEDAGEILDDAVKDPNVTTAQANLHKERAGHRKWLAGKFSEDYADRSAVGINVSIGELHLDALKHGGLMPAKPEAIAEADYEVIEEPDVIAELKRGGDE